MKKQLLLFTFLCLSSYLFGQISQGGMPPSFELMTNNYNYIPVKNLPGIDIQKFKTDEEKNGTSYRIGEQIPVDYTAFNSGIWQTLPNGSRIWRLHIQADEKARAINPYFDDFYLPKGSRLFIYNKNKTHILGAFTQHNNHESGRFSIGLIHDDNLILEYHEPPNVNDKMRLSLSSIGYAFRGVKSLKSPDGFGDSGACEININCSPEGDEWQDEKNASVRILTVTFGFMGWCSGAMVNNTRQDCTPYMLGAMHCATGLFGIFIDEDEFNDWIFYFNYESPDCANPASEGDLASQSVSGASLVAYSDDGGGDTGSDFVLLQLNSSPPADYNAYYLGWNNEDISSPEGVTIHHPEGDIMKISHYDEPLVSTTYGGPVADTHWDVSWSPTASGHGVTEGGSSGSPIFNNNGELIGTLTGGQASCSALTAADQYGKFSYHWESNGTDPQQQLKPWLDPDNTGATSLAGVYAPCAVFAVDAGTSNHINPEPFSTQCDMSPITPIVTLRNFGDDVLTNLTISYTINGGMSVDFNWTGSLANSETEDVTLTPFTPPAGTWDFESYTSNPNGITDENPGNDSTTTTHVNIDLVSLPFQEDFEDADFNPTINDLIADNPNNDSYEWARTTDASGYDMGDACAVFDNFEGTQLDNPIGTIDALFTPIFDFSGQTDPIFAMDVAYARFDDELFDSLSVMVSIDCGDTFELLWADGAEGLATTPDVEESFTPADSSEWRTIVLDLAPYQGNDAITFAIVNHSGWGNRMFVDNINIGTPGCGALQANIDVQDGGCSGGTGSLTAVPSGGAAPYTYQWSNNETTPAIGGLALGAYTVTITDADGCLTVASANISGTGGGPELSLNPESNTTVSCPGDSDANLTVMVMNGTAPYTYQWNTGDSTMNLDNQPPGTYTAIATDANGCVGLITIDVTEPDELALIPSSLPSSGNDGVATVNVAGGTPPYEYMWSDGQTTQSATGLATGTYSVVVTDANGCTVSGNVTVSMFTNTVDLENLTTFELSPNPSSGEFVIHLDFEFYEKMNIFVFNALGQKIIDLQQAGKELTIPIDIKGQSAGTYFVIIQTEKGQAVRKLSLLD